MTNNHQRNKVFVPEREGHDYRAAEEYGIITPITPLEVDRYNATELFDMISNKMIDATQNDMILISGLTLSNCIATAIMSHKFGSVNFLLFRKGEYLLRRIILPSDLNDGSQDIEYEDEEGNLKRVE